MKTTEQFLKAQGCKFKTITTSDRVYYCEYTLVQENRDGEIVEVGVQFKPTCIECDRATDKILDTAAPSPLKNVEPYGEFAKHLYYRALQEA